MLQIVNIKRAYDDKPVLRGVDLDVVRGEILCLLGASGSGKTTLLRIISGLEHPDSGDIRLEGQSILGVPVDARDFGLMFQDFALFPHMNVGRNITFGLRMRGWPQARQQQRLNEVLELVALRGFERRDVSSLSGGEKQRVALARSLAPNPRLLMLDEPLGSLDAALRERLVTELREIIKRAGLTAIYVTHDQQEAFAIADRIAVLRGGLLEQIDSPQGLYQRPRTEYVARFLGFANILAVQSRQGGEVITRMGRFALAEDVPAASILLHPDGITPDANGALSGTVSACVYQGDSYRVTIEHAGGASLTFNIAARDRRPQLGETLRVSVAPDSVIPLSGQSST